MKKIFILFTLSLLLMSGCSKNTYTLYFYGMDEEVCSKKVVDEGKYTIVEIGEEINGYVFNGWLLDNKPVEEIDVHSDLNIYSSYTPIEYLITTDEPEQYVEVGETTKLRWKIEPLNYEGPVFFDCADESILEIHDDGTCKGLKDGITVVTAYLSNSAVDILVIVGEGEKIESHYFDLTSDENVVMNVGDTHQIYIQTDYNKLDYESDDSSVATVNSTGLVKAVGLGSTAIRTSTKDKNYSVMTFIYVGGISMEAYLTENKAYKVNDYIWANLDYTVYEYGKVSTINGLAVDGVHVVIDEGQDFVEVDGITIKIIEPHNGEIKFHFEKDGVSSNQLTAKCVETD